MVYGTQITIVTIVILVIFVIFLITGADTFWLICWQELYTFPKDSEVVEWKKSAAAVAMGQYDPRGQRKKIG